MSSENNISQFEKLIRDEINGTELQAPDIWSELSAQIPQPSLMTKLSNSALFKGTIATVVVGGAVAALWFSMPGDDTDKKEMIAVEQNVKENNADSENQAFEIASNNTGLNKIIAGQSGNGSSNALPENDNIVSNEEGGLTNTTSQTIDVGSSVGLATRELSGNEGKVDRRSSNTGGIANGQDTRTGNIYNGLLNIYLSDTQVCVNQTCVISAENSQLFEKIYWEVNGVRMAEGALQFTYKVKEPRDVIVRLFAEKDGARYATARSIKVAQANLSMELKMSDDRRVTGNIQMDNPESFIWHFGDHSGWHKGMGSTVEYRYDRYGVYYVSAVVMDKNGCIDTAIEKLELISGVSVKNNIITPGLLDGKNDDFEVTGEDITSYRIVIRDFTGNVVYESGDINDKWRGINQATEQLVPAGTYIYKIIYTQGNSPSMSTSGKIEVR